MNEYSLVHIKLAKIMENDIILLFMYQNLNKYPIKGQKYKK